MSSALVRPDIPAVRQLIIAAVVLTVLVSSASIALAQPARFAADELLVGFRGAVGRAEAEAVYRAWGAAKLEEFPQINVHRIRVPSRALIAVEAALSQRPEVKFVERNHRVPVQLVPSDPLFSKQWHHFTINSVTAWDVTSGTSSIVIAIADTGVNASHPDLAGRLVPGYNGNDKSSNTTDVYGHGTKVAGTSAAAGNNATGIAGVAFDARIMPIKACTDDGYCYYSAVSSGMLWAADNGAHVINLSIAGVAASSTVTSAAQYARSKGVVVVAAAGNCGCFDSTQENAHIISVSATDGADALASWSSTGNYVDLAAPGVGIYTTTINGGYGASSGTSFASPIVAGVVALMRSANPSLKPADVETLLKSTAIDFGAQGWDPRYGSGRVDAYGAVSAAAASVGTQDTTPPTVAITSPANGASVIGAVTVTVAASDSGGIARTDLYVDGSLYATDVIAPYEYHLDTTRLSNGTHVLTAKAVDAAGNVGTSSQVSINVSNTAPSVPSSDTTPPTITSLSISQNRNKLEVTVGATDDVGVVKIELYVDGKLQASSTSSPAKFSLVAKKLSETIQITAKAYDGAGNVGASTTSFTVSK